MTSITSLSSASLPLTGTERVPMDQTVGTAIAASALVVGTGYRIESLGTTNWTACGLPAGVTAAVGLTFVASAAGTGTGTAIEARTVEATTQAIANLAGDAAGTDLSYDPATRLLSSSTGGDVALPLVSPTAAGLLSAAGWLKLDSIVVDRATLTVAPVRNNSGASIAKGTPVIVTGSNGTTKTIVPADASIEATAANTLGLTLDVIANNEDGFVVTEGPLSGVNTASLAEGQLIYLSETTGAITSTRPTQPAHGVVLGWCVKSGAGTAGILYVKVDNGVELDELHDVLISSASTDQALVRASDGLWKNRTIYASTTPAALGTAGVGTSTTLARADHVHAMPSAEDVGADPSGTAAAAVAAHVAATDPHPQYLTSAELIVGDSNIATAGLSQSSLNGRPVAPFASFTVYSRGDLASLFGLVYRRKTPGTSGATLDPAMWDLQSPADGSNDCFYTVGKYFNPSIAPLLSTNAIAQNTIYFYPFVVRRRVRVNGIQVRVTTAAASTTFQVAFYAASSQRVPTGLPLANTADMTMAATGVVNSSISQTWFEVGQIYFRAINVAGSSSGILLHPSSQHTEAVNLLGSLSPFSSATNGNMELTLSWTAGTWPDMTARTTAENYFTRAAVALLVSELG